MISSIHSVSCWYMTLQCWEYGISLCRELAFQYETLYDYQSLSWIRVSKALFLLLLSNKHPLGCCEVRFSTPSIIPILIFSMRTIWHQTQCLNYSSGNAEIQLWVWLVHYSSWVSCIFFTFCDRKWKQHTMTTSLSSKGLNQSFSEWASMAGSFLSSSG